MKSVSALSTISRDWLGLRRRYGVSTFRTDPAVFAALCTAEPGCLGPYVLLCRRNGTPVGAILGRLQGNAVQSRFAYCHVPKPALRRLEIEYGGIVIDGQVGTREYITNFLQHLLAERNLDCVVLNHVRTDDRLFLDFTRASRLRSSAELHWRFQFAPGDFGKTMQRFSRNHRHNIRRKDQLLVQHFGNDVTVRVFTQPHDLDEFAAETAVVASQTYQAGIAAAFTSGTYWQTLLQTLASLGCLRGYWLVCQGRPIAFQVGCLYEDVYHLLTMGYLPKYQDLSPGTVLHCRVLSDLRAFSVQEIDYGFGDSAFKRMYGTLCWDETTLHLCGYTTRSLVCGSIERATRQIDSASRTVLNKLGVGGHAKRYWRRLLGTTRRRRGAR